jgi:lipopolysaccharide transport system ATP-binding protein
MRDVVGDTLKTFMRSARDMMRGRQLVAGDEIEEFWALKDVSFEVVRGKIVGVVGRNGAGKSTLLKVLSRITEPSVGRVEIKGRVASLLEVGTGFHGELTGRENIFLNGAILGMSRVEIRKKFDEIVMFAGVEKFLDTPVKRYSSGMYMRLAFAVAAHLEPEILLVDEVLAVGDAEFQRKCLGKMEDVAGDGRTVLFVSHNLGAIRRLCSNALLLDGGRLTFSGEVENALIRYEHSLKRSSVQLERRHFVGPLSEDISLEKVTFRQNGRQVVVLNPMQELVLELSGHSSQNHPGFELAICLFRDGAHITSCHDSTMRTPLIAGPFTSTFTLPGNLFRPGVYIVGVGASTSNGRWTWNPDVTAIEFSDNILGHHDRDHGLINIPYAGHRVQ